MLRPPRSTTWPLAVPLAATAILAAIGMFSPADTRLALANSAKLAAGATAIALPLGTLLAVLIARVDLPGRRFAAASLGLLLFLPLYVQLCGWEAAAGRIGWQTLEYGAISRPLLAGMRGAIFVHGVAAIPWVALIVGLGLWQVDPAQEEAALLAIPPWQVLARISLRQNGAFVVAAAIWTVVSTTGDMTVTNIFLMNATRERFERTYTEQFYSQFSRTADAGEATLAILPGVLGLIVIVLVSLWMALLLGRRRNRVSGGRRAAFSAGSMRLPLAVLLWLVIGVLLVVPVASLIHKAGFVVLHEGQTRIRSWSLIAALSQVAAAPRRFAVDFSWTVRVAAAAASVALLVGVALAWLARGGGWRSVPALLAVVLGLAIPGPLVGVALIHLFNHDLPPQLATPSGPKSWLLILYDDTPLAPILAQAIRALPLATLVAWHSLRTLDRDVLAAAALDGLSPWRVFWKVALPQRWRAIAAAWLAALAIAAGDLAWAHMVTPPRMDLIQRRVFGLVHSGVEEQVAAIALINVAAYLLLALLVLWLANRVRSQEPGAR
jgi:iron(III) transport system permease protein